MVIDVNNTNSNDRNYLCDSCDHAENIRHVKSKFKCTVCDCRKWRATVENVGVCKYYEDYFKQTL